jgi:surface antigen
MPRRLLASIIVVISLLLTGCQTTKKDIGAISGAVVGVLVGSLIGDGGGQAAAMIVGGAVGGIAGSLIGESLDEADQLKAEMATQQALSAEGEKVVTWKSDKNPRVRGRAETSNSYREDDAECKDVDQVFYKNGEEQSETVTYCKEDGRWSVASLF